MSLINFLFVIFGCQYTFSAKLTVLQWNIWEFGGHVDSGYEKVIRMVQQSNADIVALQEANGKSLVEFRNALGPEWNIGNNDKTVILAKHSVSNCHPFQTWNVGHPYTGVACTVSGQKDGESFTVNFWSLHLHFVEYGPDRLCVFKVPTFEYYREQQIIELTQRNARFQSDSAQSSQIPVIVAGDFNCPSHLDWTPDTAHLHCGKAVEWPVTKMLENLSYLDTYRLLHDDVATHPGITWSPVDTGLQDRIDFIFYKGEKLHPLAAQVFGLDVQPTNKSPNHGRNVWPSDHFAVLVDFQLN